MPARAAQGAARMRARAAHASESERCGLVAQLAEVSFCGWCTRPGRLPLGHTSVHAGASKSFRRDPAQRPGCRRATAPRQARAPRGRRRAGHPARRLGDTKSPFVLPHCGVLEMKFFSHIPPQARPPHPRPRPPATPGAGTRRIRARAAPRPACCCPPAPRPRPQPSHFRLQALWGRLHALGRRARARGCGSCERIRAWLRGRSMHFRAGGELAPGCAVPQHAPRACGCGSA